MRPILLALSLTALLVAAPPALAHHPPGHDPAVGVAKVDDVHCVDGDPAYREFVTEVDGERAFGIFAAPDEAPTALVVIGHGAWHTVDSWQAHIEGLTAAYGTLTVAMEYRGLERLDGHLGGDPDHPEARNWPERRGGEDLVAAAKLFRDACGIDTVILAGVSMGVSISGYAVSHLDPADHGLFDYWVTSEGVHSLLETYHAAKAAGSDAADWIEAETGGPYDPVANHDPYAERTNLLQTDAIEAAGLQRVVYLHAVADGLVPYNQSREMSAALRVPFEFHTLTSAGEGSDGTSWTDYVAGGEGPLAGHASERDPDSLLMRATFERIGAIATGDLADCGEYHVEEGAAFPDVEFRPLVTYGCDTEPGGADGAREVHGAGWWDRGTGAKHDKVDFSFDVKHRDGGLQGKLKLRDKDLDARIDARSITSSSNGAGVDCGGVVLDGVASFAFTATGSFGQGGPEIDVAQFFACGVDNGKNNEPPVDWFHVECTAGCGYSSSARVADGVIDGGNIYLRNGSGDAVVVDLDPILLTGAPAGTMLVLAATAPAGDPVLRWVTAAGATGSAAPLTHIAGVATFAVTVPAGDVDYVVWSGEVASNGVRITGS